MYGTYLTLKESNDVSPFLYKKERRIFDSETHYPLPLIQELIDKLKQSRYFTKMDVCWGYNNIQIAEGDEWKVVFRTNRGLFKPTVILLWLDGLASHFPDVQEPYHVRQSHSGTCYCIPRQHPNIH